MRGENMQHRSFTGTPADFQLVWDFMSGIFLNGSWLSAWDFCRFEWWYYRVNAMKHMQDPDFFLRNLHLWFDEGRGPAALVISESGHKDMHIICPPERAALMPHMLAWAEREWASGKACLELSIPDEDEALGACASAGGYVRANRDDFKFVYDLENCELAYGLEPGFAVESADHEGFGHDARIALIKDSFGRNTYPAHKYYFSMRAPSYRADLDLSIVAPDGQHAAYCMGWINARTGQGVIEPVGCHSAHRRRGLATAVIRECMGRMARQGVKWVHIGGASPLYDSLRPVQKIESYLWVKAL